MYYFRDEIERELESVNFLLGKIGEMELMKYTGSLSCKVQNDELVYSLRKSEVKDGKRLQKRIPLGCPDHPTVIEMKRTKFFGEMQAILQKNKTILLQLMEEYGEYTTDALVRTLPDVYHNLPEECLTDPRMEAIREWADTAYQTNPKAFPANPNVAIDGTLLRSKSEVIIYNMLLFYNIPFRYEMRTIYVGPDNMKEIRYPDFVFKLANGKELHWEHFGLLMEDDYFNNNFCGKLKLYHANGYTIGDNLIVTCDTKDRTINTQMIDRIIRGIILPLL